MTSKKVIDRIVELKGDLFDDEESCLAHCVGKDFLMGAGIATQFKYRFGCVKELIAQNKRVGDFAMIPDPKNPKRLIFYLITKEKSVQKPTYTSLRECLRELSEYCESKQIKKLAMPKIGCGLDRLDWEKVKPMIAEAFKGVDIEIKIYQLDI